MINLRILAANLLSEENNFLCQDLVVSDCSFYSWKAGIKTVFKRGRKLCLELKKYMMKRKIHYFTCFQSKVFLTNCRSIPDTIPLEYQQNEKKNTNFLVFQHANFKRRSRLKSRQIRIVLSFIDKNISYQREGFCLKIIYRKF